MNIRVLDLNAPEVSLPTRERLCSEYYDLIYRPAFPILDEAEDPGVWLPLMVDQPPLPKPIVRILLAACGTEPPGAIKASALLGGLNFEFYRKSRVALVTYLCVRPDARGKGVARLLLGEAIKSLKKAYGNIPVFAEAEEPKGQPDKPTKEWATMRLSILAHLGFSEIPINYRQPSLAPGKQPLSNLKFLLNSTHGATIGLNILKSFMHEFYAGFDEKVDELIMFGALPPDEIRTKPLGDSL